MNRTRNIALVGAVVGLLAPWLLLVIVRLPMFLRIWDSPQQAHDGMYRVAAITYFASLLLTVVAAGIFGARSFARRKTGAALCIFVALMLFTVDTLLLANFVEAQRFEAVERNRRLGY